METATRTRTNRYAGRCTKCGGNVPAEQGILTGSRATGWGTEHATCPEVAPSAPTAPAAAPTGQDAGIGVYVTSDGRIIKVQDNKAKTAKYAKRWIEIGGERLVDATEAHVNGDWIYEPGLIREATTARRMTLAEAKHFILRYGKCVRCGRRLKAAQSVERGIGPVCINYFGGASAFGEPAEDADGFITWNLGSADSYRFQASQAAADAEIASWAEVMNRR